MKHLLDTNIAKKYDVNIALFLQSMSHWTQVNLANQRNIYDGHCWTYNTLDALLEIFDYWSRRQLETVIKNAVAAGLIIKGNYNQTKYDRTVWYALTYKAYEFFEELNLHNYLETLYLSISPKCEMDFTKWCNRFHQYVTPIPNTKPVNKPNIKDIDLPSELSDENQKSDYPENQTKAISKAAKSPGNIYPLAKSDYHKNQTKNNTVSRNKEQYDINNILLDNNFQIPEETIQDWLFTRNKKKCPVTRTAWRMINKSLAECLENGIDPICAFDQMVASGWSSLKFEWVAKQSPRTSKSNLHQAYEHDDTGWISDLNAGVF